jgi:hypothetical protein
VENISTFPEIKRTTHENNIPIGSAIIVSTIWVLEIVAIVHSRMAVSCDIIEYEVGIIIKISNLNTIFLAKPEIKNF